MCCQELITFGNNAAINSGCYHPPGHTPGICKALCPWGGNFVQRRVAPGVGSLRIQPPLIAPGRWGRSRERASAIYFEKFHTDDVNHPSLISYNYN